VGRAQRGEGEAFAMLVEAYQTPVYNLCYRMLGEPAEAEDAAQETFLRAYRGIRRYDPERPFATWLLAIASHYCIDRIRRKRIPVLSVESLEPGQEYPDAEPGPEERLAVRERREIIDEISRRLEDQDRAVIVLRYWYDMSCEEIGQALSLSVSAVKSRLHRARRELAQRWLDQERQTAALRGRRHEPSAV
jgi:RNA polymerase sigma-70 factor (ECF subfamily)